MPDRWELPRAGASCSHASAQPFQPSTGQVPPRSSHFLANDAARPWLAPVEEEGLLRNEELDTFALSVADRTFFEDLFTSRSSVVDDLCARETPREACWRGTQKQARASRQWRQASELLNDFHPSECPYRSRFEVYHHISFGDLVYWISFVLGDCWIPIIEDTLARKDAKWVRIVLDSPASQTLRGSGALSVLAIALYLTVHSYLHQLPDPPRHGEDLFAANCSFAPDPSPTWYRRYFIEIAASQPFSHHIECWLRRYLPLGRVFPHRWPAGPDGRFAYRPATGRPGRCPYTGICVGFRYNSDRPEGAEERRQYQLDKIVYGRPPPGAVRAATNVGSDDNNDDNNNNNDYNNNNNDNNDDNSDNGDGNNDVSECNWTTIPGEPRAGDSLW